jgi:hypothetical protein
METENLASNEAFRSHEIKIRMKSVLDAWDAHFRETN